MVDGVYRLTYAPGERAPIEEFLRSQKRFAHLLQPENADLLAHMQRLGPAWLQRQARGDLVTGVVGGVEAMEGYYARYLPTMRMTALLPLVILVAVFPADWVSGTTMLVAAPLIPLFMWMIGKGAEELNQKQWRVLAFLGARFLDTLQGLTTLKLFGAGRREAAVVAQVSDDYRRHTMRVLRVALSDEELAARRKKMDARGMAGWKPVERQRKVSKALQAYAAMTTSASRGAVRDVTQVQK